jgi:hypothetical protein
MGPLFPCIVRLALVSSERCYAREKSMTLRTFATKFATLAAIGLLAWGNITLSERSALAAKSAAAHGPASGHLTEIIAPNATIVSTVQDLTCGSSACSGSFPKAGQNRQLNITRMSCFIQATGPNDFRYAEIQLRSGADVFLLRETLPVDFSGPGIFSLNRAVDLQLVGAQHMFVFLEVTDGGAGTNSTCTATGTLNTLG